MGGSDAHRVIHKLSQDALRITAYLNGSYHEPEELRKLFSELIEKSVDDSFCMFPPFYTDCGKSIHIGKNILSTVAVIFRIKEVFISGIMC